MPGRPANVNAAGIALATRSQLAPGLTCDGCGVCCLAIGHPPFLLDLKEGVLHTVGGDDSEADLHRFRTAPSEAQTAYFAQRETVNAPCAWFDLTSKRCRYYDFRPDICRTFDVGGKWCFQQRELHQLT
jgi:Fe-S-cluster containining protein